MAIFKRKPDEYDEEDEVLEQEEKDNKKFTKKFKDLKPANRKKRKEPPKPWGKKERYFVLLVLVVTFVIAMILAISSQNNVSINLNKPSINFDFSKLNPFHEKVIIIQKK